MLHAAVGCSLFTLPLLPLGNLINKMQIYLKKWWFECYWNLFLGKKFMALKNMKEQLPQAFALTRLTKITIKENFSSSKMVSEEFCQKKLNVL